MWIFQIFALLPPDRSLFTGAIVARDKPHSVEVAVGRVKKLGGKVTRIVPVLDVTDVRKLHHTGLTKALTKIDQCELVAWHLREIVTRQIKMVSDLREIIKNQQQGNKNE